MVVGAFFSSPTGRIMRNSMWTQGQKLSAHELWLGGSKGCMEKNGESLKNKDCTRVNKM